MDLLTRLRGWRVQVRLPSDPPPPDRPLVAVFNHTSSLDGFLLSHAAWRGLGHWFRPLVKAEVFEVPVLGTLARKAGAIAVHRGADAGRELAYDDAVAALRAGGTVLIAPEGTVTHDGRLLPLRHGAARLALEAGVDVLVVSHFGAQRGYSPVVRWPQRGAAVTVAFDLIRPASDEDATALTGRMAATMLDRAEELLATYPDQQPEARWWPPYAAPASPTATARENLERYQESMVQAIADARERMARLAAEQELEARLVEARDRAQASVADLAARSREQVEHVGSQARELVEHAREQAAHLQAQAQEQAAQLQAQVREQAEHLQERLPGWPDDDGDEGNEGENGPVGDDQR